MSWELSSRIAKIVERVNSKKGGENDVEGVMSRLGSRRPSLW